MEKSKRKAFSESRRNNIKGNNQHIIGHMTTHMEDENVNVIEDKNINIDFEWFWNDYDFWVIAFEKHDGEVLARVDADENEVNNLLSTSREWIHIWKEYDGPKPDKWVVWPHSKSKGYIERLEQNLT